MELVQSIFEFIQFIIESIQPFIDFFSDLIVIAATYFTFTLTGKHKKLKKELKKQRQEELKILAKLYEQNYKPIELTSNKFDLNAANCLAQKGFILLNEEENNRYRISTDDITATDELFEKLLYNYDGHPIIKKLQEIISQEKDQ